MTLMESGRKGGVATRDNHITLCPLCGTPQKNQYLADTGKKGGIATLQKHGRVFYSQVGRLGGRGNTKEKRIGRSPSVNQAPAEEVITNPNVNYSNQGQGQTSFPTIRPVLQNAGQQKNL